MCPFLLHFYISSLKHNVHAIECGVTVFANALILDMISMWLLCLWKLAETEQWGQSSRDRAAGTERRGQRGRDGQKTRDDHRWCAAVKLKTGTQATTNVVTVVNNKAPKG